MRITKNTIETTPGPREWFTGAAYIDTIATPTGPSRVNASSVRFTPGARTAWHAHPNGQTIYVTNRGSCDSTPGTVSVIDSGTRTVVATVQVGSCPRFLDRNPRTGLVYVPNAFTSRSVSVIQDEN